MRQKQGKGLTKLLELGGYLICGSLVGFFVTCALPTGWVPLTFLLGFVGIVSVTFNLGMFLIIRDLFRHYPRDLAWFVLLAYAVIVGKLALFIFFGQ